MDKQISRLRRRIVDSPLDRRGRRKYGPKLRQELTELTKAWRSTRRPQHELAKRLGVSEQTLATWRQAPERKERSGGAVKKVRVAAPIPHTSKQPISIVMPSGARIEGVDVAAAIAIARELG